MLRKDYIETLLINHETRLQKLKEKQAFYGQDTSPHILMEIEIIETEIKRRKVELFELNHAKQQVQIYLQGDFSSVSADRWSAAIEGFAAAMGIVPQAIKVYRV
ncbi:MAG: hypothetical protein GY845_22285 [Planctomycetes bacterium]|nr:hypothetical protein [Planctomycetota bacterium]